MAIPGNATTAMDPYTERLASVPQIPRKNGIQGDGTEPGAVVGSIPAEGEQPAQKPTLVDASDADVFRTIDALSKSQARLRRNRFAIDTYHGWLDSNVSFGRLDKIPNQNIWVAKMAPGVTVERGAAVPGKAADLCDKVTDALFADPPKPNPQPHVDDPTADAAADLASEFLRQNAGEAGVSEVSQYRWAFRNALTRASSFLEYDVDAEGGGYQAYQLLSHPQATDEDLKAAIQADPKDPSPTTATDPATGEELPAVDPILRYVSPTGQFVDQAVQADKVWLPKLVIRKHHRTKVVCFPPTARIEEAQAAILTDYCDLSEGMKRWPDTVGTMNEEQLKDLASWRPTEHDMIVPFTFRALADGASGPSLADVGSLSPLLQKRMWFHRLWVHRSSEYPDGLLIDISGANKGGLRLGQESMEFQVTLPKGGPTMRCRDIPLVQITPIQDVDGLDPMGWPFEARFDGSAQADAQLMSEYLDALARMANPHVFIPSNTPIDEDQWFDRSVPLLIGNTDKPPFYESFPPLPPIVAVSEYLQKRQDTASGLSAEGQGLDSPNSSSGVAKKLTIRQAQISLAGMQQDYHSGQVRGWRLAMQWVQSKWSVPQLMQYTGDEVSNEEQWWTGADFAAVDERVGMELGTGTMMTAEDKANYVRFLQDSGWKTPEEAAEIGVTGIARDLGIPKDQTKAAIDRTVDVWLKGVPFPEWEQQWTTWKTAQDQYKAEQAQFQAATQARQQFLTLEAQAAAGPASPGLGPEQQNEKANVDYENANIQMQVMQQTNPGVLQQPVAPIAPQIPKPWTPFEPRANDTEPPIAAKWMKALSHLQMTPQYMAQPKAWRECADERYTEARQAVATASGAAPAQPAQQGHAPAKQSGPAAQVPGSSAQSPMSGGLS